MDARNDNRGIWLENKPKKKKKSDGGQKQIHKVKHLIAALKACKSLERGKKIHIEAIQGRDDSNIYIASTLISMYAKCGSMADARLVFDKMKHHDVVSWNVLILGYAENGKAEISLELFMCMQDQGCSPNRVTCLAALKACTRLSADEVGSQVDGKIVKLRCLEKGKSVHLEATKSGHDVDIYVANTLIDMYGKCGSMGDARRVFDRMERQDLVSWNVLMLGYAENGDSAVVFDLLSDMQVAPDAYTFVAALKSCSGLSAKQEEHIIEGNLMKMRCLEKGRSIHLEAVKRGYDSDIYVSSMLIDMYAKCGCMVEGRFIFDRMHQPNVVSWTAMILGYAENGEFDLALHLFARMQEKGCVPDARTFVTVLKACISLAAREEAENVDGKLVKLCSLEKGKAIHLEVSKSDYEMELHVANTLVDMYSKTGSMVSARHVFDKMQRHDTLSWNVLLLGYIENGECKYALYLFSRMWEEGCVPDARTFVAALKACTSLAAEEDSQLEKLKILKEGIAIHSKIVKEGYELDMFIGSALIGMYAKCGSMVDARLIFDRMQCHDVVSWTTLMLGYAENGEAKVALDIFSCMSNGVCMPNRVTYLVALKACTSLTVEEEGTIVDGMAVKISCLEKVKAIHFQIIEQGHNLNIYIESTLVDIYAKCGSMLDARLVFDNMHGHNVVAWTALMSGYADIGEAELALQIFSRMQNEGCAPDAQTFVAAIMACGSISCLERGKKIHMQVCQSAEVQADPYVSNCLVDFYGKCGCMVEAQEVFDAITSRDLVTWNALIAGYSRLGDSKTVFDLFERISKECLKPNSVTFLCILNVCTHTGLVEKGKEYFKSMCLDYRITPTVQHYTCMVDLLGRANNLEDAVTMIMSTPFESNVTLWRTILSACRKWINIDVGKLAFEVLLKLDDKDAATYILMASIYGPSDK